MDQGLYEADAVMGSRTGSAAAKSDGGVQYTQSQANCLVGGKSLASDRGSRTVLGQSYPTRKYEMLSQLVGPGLSILPLGLSTQLV